MSDTKTYRAISVKLAAFLCREKWSDELPEKTRKEMQRLVKEWQDVDRDNTERPEIGKVLIVNTGMGCGCCGQSEGAACSCHVARTELATAKADCERWSAMYAKQADELVAVKAKFDLATSNFHTMLNERFLENSELRQRAEAAEMRMKQLLDALRLCKLYGSQGDIDDGRKGATSVSYYVDKAIDAAEAALATTPPADGAQSS